MLHLVEEVHENGQAALAGDAARAATTDEAKGLRREAGALKERVADLMLENERWNQTRANGMPTRKLPSAWRP